MKKILLALTLALAASVAQAVEPTAMQLLQQQIAAAAPAAQQAVQQTTQQAIVNQALQQLAANPQMLTSMVNSLSPQQQATLMQQALTAGQKIFTQQEQTKLLAFTSSPEGASIAAKMPQLVQQLTPMVLQMYAANGTTNVAPAAGK